MFKNNLQKKTNIIFYQIISIGFSFLAFFLFLAIILYPKLILITQSLFNKLEVFCGCANNWSAAKEPYIFAAIILSGLSLAAFFCLLIIRILKLKSSTRQFIKLNLRHKKRVVSLKLNNIVAFLGLENRVIEINVKAPVIFCFGFFRTKICISAGLVEKLTAAELKAVLLHERYHLFNRQPAKIFIIKVLTKTLFFVPGIRILAKEYLTFAELAADERATNSFKNRIPLANALDKILEFKERRAVRSNLAISFFGVIDERVSRLVDNDYAPQVKIFSIKEFISIFLTLAFLAGFNIFIYSSKPVIVSHSSTSCLLEQIKTNSKCQAQPGRAACAMDNDLGRLLCRLD